MPHVFSCDDLEFGAWQPRDAAVCSVCCGADVRGGGPAGYGRNQPSCCFVRWHTTDGDAMEE